MSRFPGDSQTQPLGPRLGTLGEIELERWGQCVRVDVGFRHLYGSMDTERISILIECTDANKINSPLDSGAGVGAPDY